MLKHIHFIISIVASSLICIGCATPQNRSIGKVMQDAIATGDPAGSVTVVVSKDRILHLQAQGMANIERKDAMRTDSLFWIASMTKPITGVALLMLQDEGKLNVADPVSKYIPAFADLKTPSGKPANLTIAQLMTHTSGLGEGDREATTAARTLEELIPLYLAKPMQFEPGARWAYCQSGINTGARIVEIASGMSFDAFCQKRLFDPLGMKQTTFYPDRLAGAHRVVGYRKNAKTGAMEPGAMWGRIGQEGHPPLGNGGLYSTGPDYARFCQMLLNNGTLNGKQYLSADAMKYLTTVQTGDLPTGFLQTAEWGNHGKNYGWGIGTCILRAPHEGVAEMLSPGTYGHGGAWGTQAWIDPVRGVAYILMVQRPNAGNSDASELRRDFQRAAAGLGK